MQEWKIYKVSTTVYGEKRKAPEGTWVLGVLKYLANISVMDHLFITCFYKMRYEDVD